MHLILTISLLLSTIAYAIPIHIAIADEEKEPTLLISLFIYFISLIISLLILICCILLLIFVSTKIIKK